jgi:hypothetical protein
MNRRGTWILDGFRLMAAQAIRSRRFVAEQRLHTRLGVAGGANYVITEASIRSIGREAMTKRAIGPESGAGIDPGMGIHMLGVGEVKNDRPHILVAGEGQQIVTASWRKGRMALGADLLFDLFVEIIIMTGRTLVMSGPLINHRALFFGYVASVTVQADLLCMVLVQVKRRLRLFLGIGRGGGATPPSLLPICLKSCT